MKQICDDAIESLANQFISNPANFVNETDLQVKLVEILRSKLDYISEWSDAACKLENTSNKSYKKDFSQAIDARLRGKKTINPVHTEVSIKNASNNENGSRRRYDVVVFNKEMRNPIKWVGNGSKAFCLEDIDAVFELKFIKNKYRFPVKNTVSYLESKNQSKEGLKKELNLQENKIGSDLQDLNKLHKKHPHTIATYMLIFSNNDYLFQKMTDAIKENKHWQLYQRIGKAAREEIQELAKNKTNKTTVLYAYPCDYEILTN